MVVKDGEERGKKRMRATGGERRRKVEEEGESERNDGAAPCRKDEEQTRLAT